MADLIVVALLLVVIYVIRLWQVPETKPKVHGVPGEATTTPLCPDCKKWRDLFLGEHLDELLYARRRIADLESRGLHNYRMQDDYRAVRDAVHAALCRTREHHLPGWSMSPAGMCPTCKDSKIFEHAQTLLGRMNFDVPPADPPPPPGPEPREPA